MTDVYLPLLTYPDPSREDCLPAIADAARHIGAALDAEAIEVDIPDVGNPLSEAILHVHDLIEAAERRSREAGNRLLEAAERVGVAHGVTIRRSAVRALPALVADVAVSGARARDLTAFPLDGSDAAKRGVAEILLFESGRPVLLVPESYDRIPDFTVVVVATDFSRTATRALFDAAPFLSRAHRVHVVTAPEEKDTSRGDRDALARHFERRGLEASFTDVPTFGRPIGEVLQDQALALGAGLLVMGAYGHTRLRDFVLGGATRSVIHDPKLPIFLSH